MPDCGEISSWSELSRLIEEYAGQGWIFRGVKKRSYTLTPKIGRKEAKRNPVGGEPLPHARDEEEEMVREFKRNAKPYISIPPENELEWLAIGQHRGLPTRLLDWTESLLVAAYFAAEAAGTGDEPPAIYGVTGLPMLDGDEDPFEQIPFVSIYRPPHISPRIPAQRAVFTVHPNPSEDFFKEGDVRRWTLTKARETFWLKQIVDFCGINRASLFPDLDGLAQYSGWRYKWGRYKDFVLDRIISF